MTRYRTYFGSAGFAASAAGPVFSMALPLGVYVTHPANSFPIPDPGTFTQNAPLFLFLMIASLMFGAVISLIPNIIGMHAMGWLGARNEGLQMPVAWALAGAAAAGVPAYLLQADPITSPPYIFAFALTGSVCAVICRHRMQWCDTPVA